MCGIVGLAGNLLNNDLKTFLNMLYMDTCRGLDSTGVIHANANETTIEKAVGSPGNLYEYGHSDLWDLSGRPVQKLGCPRVLIGHNRAATIGKVNEANAHPFSFGTFHGVHNGSLDSYPKVSGNNFDTDSEHFMYQLSKLGVVKGWDTVRGAAAVATWEEADSILTLARNDERPMFYAEIKGGSAIMFASEKWMIEVSCNRRTFSPDIKGVIKELPEHSYIKFKISMNSADKVEEGKLPDNTRFVYNYPTNRNKSAGNFQEASAQRVKEKIKEVAEEEKDVVSLWSKATHHISTKDFSKFWEEATLRLEDGSQLSPYISPGKSIRHLRFRVTSEGKYKGKAVFAYLTSYNTWIKWREQFSTADLYSLRQKEFDYKLTNVPRSALDGKQEVIAFHAPLSFVEPVQKEVKRRCCCCHSVYDEEDLDITYPDYPICVICTQSWQARNQYGIM